jgi:hypothetical protein
VPPVERLNRSGRCTIETVCLHSGFVGGAPESGSVRRWMGVGPDGVGEIGVGGDLLPRTSGLGVLVKNPQVYAKTHHFG